MLICEMFKFIPIITPDVCKLIDLTGVKKLHFVACLINIDIVVGYLSYSTYISFPIETQ